MAMVVHQKGMVVFWTPPRKLPEGSVLLHHLHVHPPVTHVLHYILLLLSLSNTLQQWQLKAFNPFQGLVCLTVTCLQYVIANCWPCVSLSQFWAWLNSYALTPDIAPGM